MDENLPSPAPTTLVGDMKRDEVLSSSASADFAAGTPEGRFIILVYIKLECSAYIAVYLFKWCLYCMMWTISGVALSNASLRNPFVTERTSLVHLNCGGRGFRVMGTRSDFGPLQRDNSYTK